jgi:hypothetical protein
MGRDFLMWTVNEAIEHREVATDIDPAALVETLLILLCGVGFYAGYVSSYEELLAVSDVLRRLLEGALWRPEV